MNINDRHKNRLTLKDDNKRLHLMNEIMEEPVKDVPNVLGDKLVPRRLEMNVLEDGQWQEYYDE